MTASSDKKLDAALEQWVDMQAPSSSQLDELRASLSQRVRDEAFLEGDVFEEDVVASPKQTRPRLVWFSLGVAVSILVVLAVRWSWGPDADPNAPNLIVKDVDPPSQGETQVEPAERPSQDNGALRLVALEKQDLAEKSRLFNAVQADFGPRLRWIAETGGDVQLGLASDEPAVADTGQPLVLRLVLTSKRAGDADWKKIWSKDVLARNEAAVDDIPGPGKLRLWCYALPDGLISVETELTLDTPIEGRYVFNSVQKPGSPRQVLAVKIGSVEYALYQTVSLLDQFAGQPESKPSNGRAS